MAKMRKRIATLLAVTATTAGLSLGADAGAGTANAADSDLTCVPPSGAKQNRETMGMRALRRVSMVAGIVAMSAMGFATQAQASQNSGWVYTSNQSGAVYFDADLNGYPGLEKITVCDNTTDGRGTQALVMGKKGDTSVFIWENDPSNDGHCRSTQGDFFTEETDVSVGVWEYWGDNTAHNGEGSGVA